MSYLSVTFLALVAMALLMFYIAPVKHRWNVLVLVSLIFYMSYDPRYVLYLLFVALSTFLCARAFQKYGSRKWMLILCIAGNAFLWFAIKQLSGIVNYMNAWVRFSPAQITLPLIFRLVPLGISYYMLQSVSYLVDVYCKKIPAERSFGKYLLYLAYFPAVVQGPISRYDALAPQFLHEKKLDMDAIFDNTLLILLGLIKKLVVADRLNLFVSHCFSNIAQTDGAVLALGAIGFAFQIYADFSGCVDICRGISGYFGIDLPQNFCAPYHATSVKDFWSRWHISLSQWLRDYIYIPLGGNRKGSVRKKCNLAITFLVSGIWHGAGVTYLIWGVLHAAYQIIGEVTHTVRQKLKHSLDVEKDSASERFYQQVITFGLITVAWIFFRADNVKSAFLYLWRILTQSHVFSLFAVETFEKGIPLAGCILIGLHIVMMLCADGMRRQGRNVVKEVRSLHFVCRWGIYGLLIMDLFLFGVYGGYDPAAFMYGGY